MGKYKVKCYYTYVGVVEVDADNVDDAFEIGKAICDDMETDDLSFVDYSDAEVIDPDGFIHEC